MKKKQSPPAPVNFLGIDYPSANALAHDLEISYSTIRWQLAQGLSFEEAVIYSQEHSRKVTLWKKTFKDLIQLTKFYGVDHAALLTLIYNGESIEEAMLHLFEKKPFVYNGKRYVNLTDLCYDYCIQPEYLTNELRKGFTLDQVLNMPRGTSNHGKKIYYAGEWYVSRIDLCDAYNISARLVRSTAIRFSEGPVNDETFLKAFYMILNLKTESGIPDNVMLTRTPGCVYNGIVYRTLESFFKPLGLTTSAVWSFGNRYGLNDLKQILISMQQRTKTGYRKGTEILYHKELFQPGCTQSTISEYEKCETLVYPQLSGMDFVNDFIYDFPVKSLLRELCSSNCTKTCCIW